MVFDSQRVLMLMDGGGGGTSALQEMVTKGQFKLYCVLIYSDLDRTFFEFLQETHKSLSVLSGDQVFVFWFDHFESDSLILWNEVDVPSDRKSVVNRGESLKLARALDIPMSETPCLLLCNNLEADSGVVYSFSNNWTFSEMSEHFKAVFDIVDEMLHNQGKKGSRKFYDDIQKRLNLLRARKWVKSVTSNRSLGTLLRAIATGDVLAK